eukprot:CAMPEP_0119105136 /NCGR_PEP_ID=MMETSP1180-20130426/3183_1 /TAXON_ID=3052 ORGANISM="Chlamydomonas cf sp, Strain CCMP681" /NCGR_SAMPLE_ID=MMETSP1180 /ASSEMBLY_ACC=CAM_ASM_000741 /LENGTH=359 /DNA_ID=CAMNT_0007090119 /DNA_START=24 /DNA_END=1103 /DNA_ORIENTATION=-
MALSSKQAAFVRSGALAPARVAPVATNRGSLQVLAASTKEIRDRISSVKNTRKITEAMKLVAAAKVRRAQAAVINSRPFTENLVNVLFGVNQRLRLEDVDSPLCNIRPVKTVLMVVLTGDRGLCGGYNNFILKKAEKRYRELTSLGLNVKTMAVGNKCKTYMRRRPKFNVVKEYSLGTKPTTKDAQAISDEVFASFVSAEVDKVELVFTKFVSLISSEPTIQTLLPMTPAGELCGIDGSCVDAADDEIFKLTTRQGKFVLEREKAPIETSALDPSLIFEQEPAQILDALLPLYLNSCVLRSLQEGLASELAARMNAMSNASDNAKELTKSLSAVYNRKRQAKITSEISEIVAGASASAR